MEEDKEKVTEGSKEDSSQSESLQESGLGESVNGDKSTPRDQDSGLEDSTDPASEKSERREGSQKGSKKRSSKREQRKSGRVTSSSIGSELEKTVAGFDDSSALETSDNSELSEKSERSRSSSRGTPSGVKRRVVRILIKGGKNLREIAGKKKINIPYVVASFNGQKKTFKSKLQNTLAPSWNEKLQFVIGEDTEENVLKFQVYDEKGQTKDELLGETAIEVATLEWKKKRFDYKDHKLTHPKMEVQGKLSFILLLTERVIPEAELAALESARKVLGDSKGADEAKKQKKDEKKLKKEEKQKKKEEKAKKKKEDKERERTLKKSRPLVEEGKGTLGKGGKVVPTEKHNIETKGGIAAPPDLLWQFISEFHNVEEWLPKTPAEAVPSAENGKLLRRIQYPEYESVEQLDEKNDAEMKLRFSSVGGKDWKGVAGAVAYSITLQVVPVGKSRSRLTWAVEYELPPGASEEEAKKFFETLVEAGMDGLKVAAEG